jgi:hypothetical protein
VPPLRPARPRGPFFRRLRRCGELAGYVALLLLALFFVGIGVAAAHDRGEPRVWGTFVEESREYGGRGGEHITGRWASADGQRTLEDVTLNGSTDPSGRAAAYAQPTAYLGSDTTVSDGSGEWISVVLPPAFVVLSLAFLVGHAWASEDLPTVASWFRRLRRR